MRALLFRALLRLHPRAFRERNGEEIAWVYEQCARDGGASGACRDALASLLRHRLREPRLWSAAAGIAGGIAGALVTLWAGSVVTPRPGPLPSAIHVDGLIVITTAAMAAVGCTVALSVALFRSLPRRRV